MKNINVCLLAAVACTYSLQVAANSLEHNLNSVIEDNVYSLRNSSAASHTVTPLELEPILASNSGIKLAAICALAGGGGCNGIRFGSSDNDLTLDDDKQCKEDGYNLTTCPDSQTPENICPYSSKYFKSCKCPAEYKYTQANCNSSYPNSTLADSRCTSNGIVYASACICNTTTYPYTSSVCNGKEELGGTICKDTAGITYGSTRTCIGGNDKYKHTDETCKSSHSGFANWTINNDICQSKASDCVCTPSSGSCNGYNLDSDTCDGGSKIGESCNNGCQLKWKCKDLCPYKGTISSCPDGYVCTFEECSSKFYISGCAVNYDYWCKMPETNCSTLGYTKVESDCDASVKCPFDTSKVFCTKNLVESCEVGSILYSDKSCSKVVVSGKTAIGIVFDKDIRLAVALERSSSKIAWAGSRGSDIPALDNCYPAQSLNCGTDGKSNTAAIISYSKANSSSYPAAEYCNNYTTVGTVAGNWYLPSMAELKQLSNAKTQVNASLQLLGKTILDDTAHWSSTEFDKDNSLALYITSNSNSKWVKDFNFSVLPVLTY